MEKYLRKLVLLTVLLVTTSSFLGCATTAPFTKGKPLRVEGSFFSRSFTQDGKTVRFDEVMSSLKKEDTSKDKASMSEIWYYASLVSGFAGGYLIGDSAFNQRASQEAKQSGILIGVGLIGVSAATAYFSDKLLVEGAESYNSALLNKKQGNSIMKLIPQIGAIGLKTQIIPSLGFSYQLP